MADKAAKKDAKARSGKPGRAKELLDADGLTPAQQVFKRAILEGDEVEQAAIKAGKNRVTGYRWIKLPAMIAAIRTGQALLEQAGICTRLDILREAFKLAKSDLRDVFTDDNGILNVKDFPDNVAPAIASVKVTTLYSGKGDDKKEIGFTTEVKVHPKVAAMDLCAKLIGAFAAPKVPLGPDGKPVTSKKVFLIPQPRREEDMADYGKPQTMQQALPAPEPEEGQPVRVFDLSAGARRLKQRETGK